MKPFNIGWVTVQNYFKRLSLVFSLIGLLIGFQNCSDVGFSDSTSTVNRLPNSPIVEDVGVEGGHFDLDTATSVYDDGDGDTNQHVHEYDDRYNTNTADFFNLENSGFDEVDETIPANRPFYIRVANGDLSPRVALEINGVAHNVSTVQHGPFSLSGVAGTTQLSSLRAIVASDSILNAGLVSSQPSCVIRNRFSNDGRYRNGALVIQAIPSDQIALVDSILGVAGANQALLWEAMIFWHEPGGDCR